jgi:hypothetical protein
MGQVIKLGPQIHADVYKALACIESHDLDRIQPERLLRISSLAGELLAALDELLGHDHEQTDQASEAHTVRSEGRWQADQ